MRKNAKQSNVGVVKLFDDVVSAEPADVQAGSSTTPAKVKVMKKVASGKKKKKKKKK